MNHSMTLVLEDLFQERCTAWLLDEGRWANGRALSLGTWLLEDFWRKEFSEERVFLWTDGKIDGTTGSMMSILAVKANSFVTEVTFSSDWGDCHFGSEKVVNVERGRQSGGPWTTSSPRENLSCPQINVEYTYSSR
ncbi:hypothetical protein TNCV_4332341 [Trichonephila clavipes]|nr:hypothetical protein TNCV_4332341 [Trichonephila clavipes]